MRSSISSRTRWGRKPLLLVALSAAAVALAASNRTMQIGIPIVAGAAAGPLGASGIFWASAGLLTGAAAVVGSAGTALNNPDPPAVE